MYVVILQTFPESFLLRISFSQFIYLTLVMLKMTSLLNLGVLPVCHLNVMTLPMFIFDLSIVWLHMVNHGTNVDWQWSRFLCFLQYVVKDCSHWSLGHCLFSRVTITTSPLSPPQNYPSPRCEGSASFFLCLFHCETLCLMRVMDWNFKFSGAWQIAFDSNKWKLEQHLFIVWWCSCFFLLAFYAAVWVWDICWLCKHTFVILPF